MIGLFIGLACGTAVYFSLAKVSTGITQGTGASIPFILLAVFVPIIVLIGCAFLLTEELVFAGIGTAASLVAISIGRFIKQGFSDE